jgi:hypothetical protein
LPCSRAFSGVGAPPCGRTQEPPGPELGLKPWARAAADRLGVPAEQPGEQRALALALALARARVRARARVGLQGPPVPSRNRVAPAAAPGAGRLPRTACARAIS